MSIDLFSDPFRRAASFSYMLLKETDPDRLRRRIVEDTRSLLRADAVRLFEFNEEGGLTIGERAGVEPPECALLLEPVLAARAVVADKSLISGHPRLYPELRALARECDRSGVTVHALLVRANSDTLGAAVVHWLERERPGYEERSGAYLFWDNVGLALAISNERRRLERLAYRDELTGMPNQHVLHRELDRRLGVEESGVAVLYIDFDGMREANNDLGYEGGGDVLIATVGRAIQAWVGDGEIAARMHRAGDEFACVLLAGEDGEARAAALEAELDRLELPEVFAPIYRGASVGWASSGPDDTPASLLTAAAQRMGDRKIERRPDRRRGA